MYKIDDDKNRIDIPGENSIDLDRTYSSRETDINEDYDFDQDICHYEELKCMEDILKKYKNDTTDNHIICFFDIQGVLIKNNNFHEALAIGKNEELFRGLCDKYNEKNYVKVARFGRFYDSKLTEEFLPLILKNLLDINVELCLLTFARYSKDRENALKNHNILDFFKHQIWTGGIDKGVVMMEYLKSKKYSGPIRILFIDDKLTHLTSVSRAYREESHNNNLQIAELKLFLYTRDAVSSVKEEDFIIFWEKILKNYKKVTATNYNKKF